MNNLTETRTKLKKNNYNNNFSFIVSYGNEW